MLSREDEARAGALHRQELREDNYTVSKAAMGLGSVGWVVAWGRSAGEWEGKGHSVGCRSLNHTANELMHHGQENQGTSAHALPTFHAVGWYPLQVEPA